MLNKYGVWNMMGYTKISREQFYRYGGFANTKLVRVTRNGNWAHYMEGRMK